MTPPNVMLSQLYALRSHLDSVILAVEASLGMMQPQASGCPQCGTPDDLLQDTSTLDGVKRRRCPKCGHEWEV